MTVLSLKRITCNYYLEVPIKRVFSADNEHKLSRKWEFNMIKYDSCNLISYFVFLYCHCSLTVLYNGNAIYLHSFRSFNAFRRYVRVFWFSSVGIRVLRASCSCLMREVIVQDIEIAMSLHVTDIDDEKYYLGKQRLSLKT